MSHELREGVKIKSIDFNNYGSWRVGAAGVESITVREQCGHMAMIPSHVEVIVNSGEKLLLAIDKAFCIELDENKDGDIKP